MTEQQQQVKPNSVPELSKIPEFFPFDLIIQGIMIGVLLGDGSIGTGDIYEPTKKARLVFSQSKEKHPKYLQHLFHVFKNYNLIFEKNTGPKTYLYPANDFIKKDVEKIRFITKHHSIIYLLYLKFYSLASGEKKKVLPKTIRQDLSPIAIAYWYMDDGSVSNPTGKGFVFNTQSFSVYEVFVLCDILRRKFGVFCWPKQTKGIDVTRLKEKGIDPEKVFDKRKRYYRVYVCGLAHDKMNELIFPHLIQEIKDSKWSAPPKPRGKRKFSKVTQINLGRYIRTVEKQTTGFLVTEKIFDYNLQKIEFEVQFHIERNEIALYAEKYNNSPSLNSYPIFENWD